jgi:hypothetical protein
MASHTSTIIRSIHRFRWAAPVVVVFTATSVSCGEPDTGLAAPAAAVVRASAPALMTSTPGHPRFLTVNVGHSSELDGVNDSGTLVGTVYMEGNTRGFIKAGSTVMEFDYPGTSETTVMSGINDSGISIGHYDDAQGAAHGFARSAGGRFTPIDDPHGGTAFFQGTKPMGINDDGIIVGTYVDGHDVAHGFVDTAGVFTTLNEPDAGTTGDTGTFVDGISNAGSVIGYYVDNRGFNYGFVETSGTYTSFVAPGAGKGSGWGTRPTALANDGVVTGYAVGALGVSGWVRQGQTFYALNDPDAVSGPAAGTRPAGVNQEGREVVGKYFDAQGAMHGFIAYI